MTRRLGLVARTFATALVAATGAIGASVAAQDAPPTGVRGQIASVAGRQVTVQVRDGGAARLELSPDAKIVAMAPVQVDALTTDVTVGAAAVKQPDGRMKALLVVIHPGSIGGAGEGYFTWDLGPDSTMVQGDVRSAESGPDGRTLSIYYPQAGATLLVPPGTPVVKLTPGDAGLLREGAQVFVPSAEKAQGDVLATELVAVGEGGFVPPM